VNTRTSDPREIGDTRRKLLRHVRMVNAINVAANFAFWKDSREAEAAVAEGHLELRRGGYFLTPSGHAVLRT